MTELTQSDAFCLFILKDSKAETMRNRKISFELNSSIGDSARHWRVFEDFALQISFVPNDAAFLKMTNVDHSLLF